MHVCARHDQITLFSIHVNSEVKISDHTQEILHVNVANVSIAAGEGEPAFAGLDWQLSCCREFWDL